MSGLSYRAAGWRCCPELTSRRAEQAAAYRLLSSETLTMEHILYSHFEQTVERCRVARLVLAVLDTTTLNYDGLSGTSGLDDLGGGCRGSLGILAHVGVAVNAVGLPLGMFEADADFRRSEGTNSIRWTAGLDRTQDHARACPDTRVVTVCDREGDIWDLISRAEETGATLVVRANRGSKRRVALPSGGDANRRKGRTAKLTLRCTPVDLLPPKDRAGEVPVRIIAVSALKEDPPRRPATGKGKKSEPLHWILLTTEGEAGLETARTMLRWRIERFFHLSSECSFQYRGWPLRPMLLYAVALRRVLGTFPEPLRKAVAALLRANAVSARLLCRKPVFARGRETERAVRVP